MSCSGQLLGTSMADHADLLAEFCSITDAAPSVAESFLAAHDWQLEGALNTFFVQDPAEGQPAAPAAAQHVGAPAAAQGMWPLLLLLAHECTCVCAKLTRPIAALPAAVCSSSLGLCGGTWVRVCWGQHSQTYMHADRLAACCRRAGHLNLALVLVLSCADPG